MKKNLIVLCSALIMGYNAGEAQVKSNNVTIYNDGSAVVREIRELDFKKGVADYSITDVAEKLNPATVKIGLKNAYVMEQNFKYDLVSAQKILQKYIGKEVTLIGDKTLAGKLVSVAFNNVVIENKEGGLILVSKLDEYQVSVGAMPEGFVMYPTLVWKINSEKAGKQDVELLYQTEGMTWKAEYVALLNQSDNKIDINAWLSLNNTSGKTYTDAKLKLMAGEINRNTYESQTPVAMRLYKTEDRAMGAANEMATEKSFFEYHLYTVENPTTIANNEQKQISMFDKTNIECRKVFKYNSFQYVNSEENMHPKVFVEFENAKKNNLGIPLPLGNVRIYKSDGTDKELIGETFIKHTPKDEKVELEIGEAFDIVIVEKMLNENRLSDRVTEIEYQAEFRNRKNEDAEIQFDKAFYGQAELLKSSIEPEKNEEARKVKFNVKVKGDDTVKLTFKVRIQN